MNAENTRTVLRGQRETGAGSPNMVTKSSVASVATTIELVVGFDALLGKAAILDSLLQTTDAPATARWIPLVAWMKHNPKMTPWTVLVYRDQELVAAALLVRSFRCGAFRFETMGEPHLPSWLPSRDAGSALMLAGALVESLRAVHAPWVLHLRHLEIGCPVADALKTEFAVTRSKQEVSPRLNFREGEPLNTYLSHNTRSALARARNRFKKAGLAPEMTWTTCPAEINAAVPEILDLYRQRNIQLHQNVALLSNADYRRFFTDMVYAYAEDGRIRLLTLRLNHTLLSYAMCLESAGTLFVYSNRMSPDGAKYSAGTTTNAEVVRMAHSDPTIRCVDWGTGLQRYKLSGEVTLHPHEDLDVWPNEPARIAWMLAQRVRAMRSPTRAAPTPARWTVVGRQRALPAGSSLVRGTAEQGEGKVKEAAGRVSDNDRLEAEGKLEQGEGHLGEAKEDVKDALAD